MQDFLHVLRFTGGQALSIFLIASTAGAITAIGCKRASPFWKGFGAVILAWTLLVILTYNPIAGGG